MCMSSRQPDTSRATAPRHPSAKARTRDLLVTVVIDAAWELLLNFKNSLGLQSFQKRLGLRQIELRVARLDAQKKLGGRGAGEPLDVERRVIGRRQPIQREHSENGGERRAENGQLERDRNPHGPAVERFSADIERKADHVGVPTHSETGQAAAETAAENQRRQNRPIES